MACAVPELNTDAVNCWPELLSVCGRLCRNVWLSGVLIVLDVICDADWCWCDVNDVLWCDDDVLFVWLCWMNWTECLLSVDCVWLRMLLCWKWALMCWCALCMNSVKLCWLLVCMSDALNECGELCSVCWMMLERAVNWIDCHSVGWTNVNVNECCELNWDGLNAELLILLMLLISCVWTVLNELLRVCMLWLCCWNVWWNDECELMMCADGCARSVTVMMCWTLFLLDCLIVCDWMLAVCVWCVGIAVLNCCLMCACVIESAWNVLCVWVCFCVWMKCVLCVAVVEMLCVACELLMGVAALKCCSLPVNLWPGLGSCLLNCACELILKDCECDVMLWMWWMLSELSCLRMVWHDCSTLNCDRILLYRCMWLADVYCLNMLLENELNDLLNGLWTALLPVNAELPEWNHWFCWTCDATVLCYGCVVAVWLPVACVKNDDLMYEWISVSLLLWCLLMTPVCLSPWCWTRLEWTAGCVLNCDVCVLMLVTDCDMTVLWILCWMQGWLLNPVLETRMLENWMPWKSCELCELCSCEVCVLVLMWIVECALFVEMRLLPLASSAVCFEWWMNVDAACWCCCCFDVLCEWMCVRCCATVKNCMMTDVVWIAGVFVCFVTWKCDVLWWMCLCLLVSVVVKLLNSCWMCVPSVAACVLLTMTADGLVLWTAELLAVLLIWKDVFLLWLCGWWMLNRLKTECASVKRECVVCCWLVCLTCGADCVLWPETCTAVCGNCDCDFSLLTLSRDWTVSVWHCALLNCVLVNADLLGNEWWHAAYCTLKAITAWTDCLMWPMKWTAAMTPGALLLWMNSEVNMTGWQLWICVEWLLLLIMMNLCDARECLMLMWMVLCNVLCLLEWWCVGVVVNACGLCCCVCVNWTCAVVRLAWMCLSVDVLCGWMLLCVRCDVNLVNCFALNCGWNWFLWRLNCFW